MAVELTPAGTRGTERPKLPRPLLRAFIAINVAVYRLFGNRTRVMGARLLLLTTVGARTGQRRRATLGWFPDGEDAWLVIASAGGSARHPAWYTNMARNPDQVWIEVGKRQLRVRPESLQGAEREEVWRRIVAQSPGYGAYQQKTDRLIPVIRLRPAA
jgi:deazaflavin-dependent oxidoreductase (nitroreductase family)